MNYSEHDFDLSAYGEWIEVYASGDPAPNLFSAARNLSRCDAKYDDCRESTCVTNEDTGYPTKYFEEFHVGIVTGFGVDS